MAPPGIGGGGAIVKRMPAMLVCVAVSALVVGVPSPARGQAVRHLQPPRRAAGPFGATPAASLQARRGYLVPDPAGLARAKASATSRHVALAPADPSSPVAFRSWKG